MKRLFMPMILFSAGVNAEIIFAQQIEHTPQVMLAQTYRQQNVVGWLASEKLDGVRAYWDGSALYSRTGKRFSPPAEFMARLPPFAIDGELYLGRGRFQETISRIRSHHWQEIEFHIFDVPKADGGLLDRLAYLSAWLVENPNISLKIIRQMPVLDFAHANRLLADIEASGGEGIILRDPNAPYLSVRSEAMLKLKSYEDAECTVLAHLKGKGKYQQRLGALLCRLDNGKIIRIGSGFSDIERDNPPPINSRISFRFRGYTKSGVPRFATYWRIREE